MKTRTRTELQELLEEILGSSNVYFQPPENLKLRYPCIVYSRNTFASVFANNDSYLRRTRYSVTLIDKNPDSPYVEPIADIPYCAHTRNFITDNLNHDVFDLYW